MFVNSAHGLRFQREVEDKRPHVPNMKFVFQCTLPSAFQHHEATNPYARKSPLVHTWSARIYKSRALSSFFSDQKAASTVLRSIDRKFLEDFGYH